MSVRSTLFELLAKQNCLEVASLSDYKYTSKEDIPHVFEMLEAQEFLYYLYQFKDKIITIDADYDPDGIMSGLLLYYGLQLLDVGSKVNLYFPKTSFGFGLSPRAVEDIHGQFPDTEVLVTADNGVVAYDGVDAANAKGWQVLITDHHLGKEERVNALAVVNPNQHGDTYPFKGLCGAAVVYKLLLEYAKTTQPEVVGDLEDLVILVGLATVADVMPLEAENRYYVREALNRLDEEAFLESQLLFPSQPLLKPLFQGFAVLLEVLREEGKLRGAIDEGDFGFYLSPMLNSPRRMSDSSQLAYEVFLSESYDEAYALAEELFTLNEHRKEVTARAVAELDDFTGQATIVSPMAVGGGIVGIVAGQLVQQYGVPSFVLYPNESGGYSGSARSSLGYSLIDALDRVHALDPQVMGRYGGHAQAAGASVKPKQLDRFKALLNQAVEEQSDKADAIKEETAKTVAWVLTDQSTVPKKDFLDEALGVLELRSQEDVEDLIDGLYELQSYAPFGQGFRRPVFNLGIPTSVLPRFMGAEDQHVKWELPYVDVLTWNDGDRARESYEAGAQYVLVSGELSVNRFRGRESLQLIADKVRYF